MRQRKKRGLWFETRGLVTRDEDGVPLNTREEYHWETINVDDRVFYGFDRAPNPDGARYVEIEAELEEENSDPLASEYDRLRGNFPGC